ncbi:MAG: hypothetical protein KBS74_07975 [Clostridiales bacterium]|nr:hypothetical protein [Candidatus Cacconaster stercorequi]
MINYQELYHLLFNAVTDSIRDLEQANYGLAMARLMEAQQECEARYMAQDETP